MGFEDMIIDEFDLDDFDELDDSLPIGREQLRPFLHTDAQGKSHALPTMTNTHLRNCIELIARKIEEARMIVDGDPLTANVKKSDLLLVGITNEKQYEQDAKRRLVFFNTLLAPYVLEAAIRGMDIHPILSGAYGRSEMIITKFLPKSKEK